MYVDRAYRVFKVCVCVCACVRARLQSPVGRHLYQHANTHNGHVDRPYTPRYLLIGLQRYTCTLCVYT